MRVCVIGSGVSGLSTAFHLSRYRDVDVTVYERADVFGGRANTTADGEHCPRIFLSDYTHLFDILRQVPAADGRTVFHHLRQVRRFSFTQRYGWIEVSHLYQVLAREVPFGQRLRMIRLRPRSPLVAEQFPGANTNRYGKLHNYSRRSLARMAWSLLRSRTAYTFDGPTATCLVDPWVRHLAGRGVRLSAGTPVTALEPHRATGSGPGGITVETPAGARRYDVVVVTAFVPDMIDLLSGSGLPPTTRSLPHTHCRCFTVTLDPREKVLATEGPALYCRDGVNIVLQPGHHRCIVLVTRAASTARDFVLGKVRDHLGLEYGFTDVRVRDNQRPDEAVYSADYVRPEGILRRPVAGLYFAGSYLRNSYPVDSGEGAARTATDVCRRIARAYGLVESADAVEWTR